VKQIVYVAKDPFTEQYPGQWGWFSMASGPGAFDEEYTPYHSIPSPVPSIPSPTPIILPTPPVHRVHKRPPRSSVY